MEIKDIVLRTEKGTEEARNAVSALPRRMRTLLMVIDGNLTMQQYIDMLPNFGDVAGLLNTLEEEAMIAPQQALVSRNNVAYLPQQGVAASLAH